jgi:hypothetical protein
LELQTDAFFISAVDGDDWPPSYPGLNNAVERMPPALSEQAWTAKKQKDFHEP